MSTFDQDMTYWQSMKIVARGLIQWPMTRAEAIEICEYVGNAALGLGGALLRLVVLILCPISVPLLTWAVQIERRKTTERMAARRKP